MYYMGSVAKRVAHLVGLTSNEGTYSPFQDAFILLQWFDTGDSVERGLYSKSLLGHLDGSNWNFSVGLLPFALKLEDAEIDLLVPGLHVPFSKLQLNTLVKLSEEKQLHYRNWRSLIQRLDPLYTCPGDTFVGPEAQTRSTVIEFWRILRTYPWPGPYHEPFPQDQFEDQMKGTISDSEEDE